MKKFPLIFLLVLAIGFCIFLLRNSWPVKVQKNLETASNQEVSKSQINKNVLEKFNFTSRDYRFSFDKIPEYNNFQSVIVSKKTEEDAAWFQKELPEHLQVSLLSDSSPNSYDALYVIPTIDSYIPKTSYERELQEKFNSKILLIKKFINSDASNSLDVLPSQNADQKLIVKKQKIAFNGGYGVRFISFYTQEDSKVNGDELLYVFQGLSNDENYLISAVIAIKANTFQTTNSIEESKIQLNKISDNDFAPSVESLDHIFTSFDFKIN